MPAVKGAEIRSRRQKLGLKLGKFAERSGVGYKTLANIECGHQRFVSIEVVYLIARALSEPGDEATVEATVEDLLADDEPETNGAAA